VVAVKKAWLVLERLQKEKALMPEYNDTLADAYVQMAMQYAKNGNYNRAVELLRKGADQGKVFCASTTFVAALDSASAQLGPNFIGTISVFYLRFSVKPKCR
jgi:Tfp pilus assembly protein PilF